MAVEIRRIIFPMYMGRMVMKDGASNERTKERMAGGRRRNLEGGRDESRAFPLLLRGRLHLNKR